MKAAIWIFIIALTLSCAINESGMPAPMKFGVSGCVAEAAGMTRRDFSLPELNVVDGYRNYSMMAGVKNEGCPQNTDLPWSAPLY